MTKDDLTTMKLVDNQVTMVKKSPPYECSSCLIDSDPGLKSFLRNLRARK